MFAPGRPARQSSGRLPPQQSGSIIVKPPSSGNSSTVSSTALLTRICKIFPREYEHYDKHKRESLDTGEQFREGERLDEVVIAAGAQAAHPIINLAERTDDQGGRDDSLFPQASNDRDSIDARKHAIDRQHGIFA
jgi:hypothetical protein